MRTNFNNIVIATAAAIFMNQNASAQNSTTQPAATGADLPVREVVLFSSGVGYFEHFGTVKGDGSAELRFKTSQVNDILKSLVLQDLDGGKVAAVTYPSQDPIDKTLKSFQVDITSNPPLADLLNQLRGAKVTISVNGEKTVGVILGVEKKRVVVKNEKAEDQTAWTAVLNLVSGGKIVSQAMDPISSIELDDPKLQDELNQALLALAGARDQDKKPVKISFNGSGQRRLRLGYVVETPVWKTSYRLILDGQPDGNKTGPATRPGSGGNLQGWAIVENQTDNDWKDVELSLVSGRPISFVMDLYQPQYIPRPEVKPDLFASLKPQMYADAMPVVPMSAAPSGGRQMAAKMMRSTAASGGATPTRMLRDEMATTQPMDVSASIQSVASATNVGELFQYTVGSVSLPRQKSAMIPIITDPIEVERLSIYNQNVLPKNPLNGARVKNTTKKHLLSGPITVLDGATYAGDARIDNLPPGQERLLSYGVDLQMLVDPVDAKSEDKVQTGKIVKGVLYVTHKYLRSQTYASQNKSEHDKTLIIEHPRQYGWDLVDSAVPMEKTDAVYRFKEAVPTGQTVRLSVHEQTVTDQLLAITNLDIGSIEFYRRTGEIPKAVQDALATAIQLKSVLFDTQQQIEREGAKLTEITNEQSRIRQNLNSVAQNSQYYTRLMTKLNDQETQIEKGQGTVESLRKQETQQQLALDNYLNNLDVQ